MGKVALELWHINTYLSKMQEILGGGIKISYHSFSSHYRYDLYKSVNHYTQFSNLWRVEILFMPKDILIMIVYRKSLGP